MKLPRIREAEIAPHITIGKFTIGGGIFTPCLVGPKWRQTLIIKKGCWRDDPITEKSVYQCASIGYKNKWFGVYIAWGYGSC